MKSIIILLSALIFGLGQTPPPTDTPSQTLSQKREVLQAVVAITTLSGAELDGLLRSKSIEHDSEVSRSEAVTVVVSIQGCQSDATGTCKASADVVAYKPDGAVHSEMKNVMLTAGRGTAALKLVPDDVSGVYKVVATVRDLNSRRFAKTERQFGVK